jgi:DNA repair exonuclease SbcCD ATPase subunit
VIDVASLPFDQYQRYRLVADLLGEVRAPGRTWNVLDVGGRTALLRAFLPEDRVTLVDLEASSERPLVLGDGSALPFADASFDVVAAFDTLEHVPVARRAAFVSECKRVARSYVILAGPYQSPDVEEAEKILQQFLKDKLAVEHRYLEEHRHNGLPVRAAVESQLRDLGASVVGIGHGNLERWLALITLSMYMDYRPELRAIAARFHRFYNEKLYASDHGEPVYRHAIVAALDGARLPTHERRRGDGAAPAGAVARINELAFELVAFERERQAFEAERERLRKVGRDFASDLEGHKKTLAEARGIQAQQARVIGTLTKDLEGHQRSIGDLQRDLTLARETLEREIAGHRSVIDALRGEIDVGVRAQNETVLRFQGEIAEHKAVTAALEADLEGHRGHAVTLTRELGEARRGLDEAHAELTRLVSELRARDELIALLRSELRHRWKNLKRALGPKRPTP